MVRGRSKGGRSALRTRGAVTQVQNAPMQTAAVILAAGASTRFGSMKQLAPFRTGTMLGAVITLARDAGLDPIIAVLPPGIAVPSDVVAVINDQPLAGISRSLQLGIRAVPEDVGGAVILLGDQPTTSVDAIRAVLGADRYGAPVVAAHAGGRTGPPVLLLREAFGLAEEASGDVGLAPVLAAHGERVASVDIGRHAPDVDIRADMDRLT